MAYAFNLIQSVTVGSGGSATIDFTSIPQTYTDLYIYISARGVVSANADTILGRFNSSSSGYTFKVFYGESSGAGSFGNTTPYFHAGYTPASNSTANSTNTFSNAEIWIPNYTSNKYKTVSSTSTKEANFGGYQSGIQSLHASEWANSAAVTRITLTTESTNNYSEHSTAYLYGIKNS
jgi:hypothetical protein